MSATKSVAKAELEGQKLQIEIRILQQQKRWALWKSLAAVLIPMMTLISLVGGGYKYFKDEAVKQNLRREEVFAQGLGNLGSKDEFVRLGAVITLMSYVGQEKGFDGRVAAVVAIHAANETSIVVKRTLLGNLRQWKRQDTKLFEEFASSVRADLLRVVGDLKNMKLGLDERDALEKQRIVLERVEKLLAEL